MVEVLAEQGNTVAKNATNLKIFAKIATDEC